MNFVAMRLKRVASYRDIVVVSLVEIGEYGFKNFETFQYVLYRRRADNSRRQVFYEMISFSPLEKEMAERSFPFGTNGSGGKSWKGTTNWLESVIKPAEDPGLMGFGHSEFPPPLSAVAPTVVRITDKGA